MTCTAWRDCLVSLHPRPASLDGSAKLFSTCSCTQSEAIALVMRARMVPKSPKQRQHQSLSTCLVAVGGVLVVFWMLLRCHGSSTAQEATASDAGSKATALLGGTSISGGGANSNQWTAATREFLPQLQQREAQVALEQRWGLPPPPAAGASWRQGGTKKGSARMRIPRILHQLYIPDIKAYLAQAADGRSRVREEWAASCRRMHPGWEYAFWDLETGRALVAKHYPQYLEVFDGLGKSRQQGAIKQADALRYFIMHSMGGLYLDLDAECFVPGESWLEGADVVLQAQDQGLANGMIASVAGHPLWEGVISLMSATWKEKPHMPVLGLTGPILFTRAFKAAMQEQGDYKPQYKLGNTTVLVNPLGTWYLPCNATDTECHRQLVLERAAGIAPLGRLAGYHRYASTWRDFESLGATYSLEGVRAALCAPAGEQQAQDASATKAAGKQQPVRGSGQGHGKMLN